MERVQADRVLDLLQPLSACAFNGLPLVPLQVEYTPRQRLSTFLCERLRPLVEQPTVSQPTRYLVMQIVLSEPPSCGPFPWMAESSTNLMARDVGGVRASGGAICKGLRSTCATQGLGCAAIIAFSRATSRHSWDQLVPPAQHCNGPVSPPETKIAGVDERFLPLYHIAVSPVW